jgi:hypothetical protein
MPEMRIPSPACDITKINRILILPAMSLLLLLGACASSTPENMSGAPGERTSMSGVDFWTGGPPDRPYQVISTTSRSGADGSASYEDEKALLAADATEKGADAVIVLDQVMTVARLNQEGGSLIMAPKVDAQLIKYK